MNIDPNIIDLENRLLGEYNGRVGVFTNDSIDNGSSFNSAVALGGATLGYKQAVGKEETHLRYPDEIEYYACAIEIINSSGKTIDFFSFPVMPSSISIPKEGHNTIQKTLGGITVHGNPTFHPFNFQISGNFGRRFRRVSTSSSMGNSETTQDNGKFMLKEVKVKGHKPFSTEYKTGYGNCKTLERVVLMSKKLDENNRPYIMIFYNLSFNQKFVVELGNITFSQTRESNMIWNYNLNMNAVAYASTVMSYEKIKKSLKNITDYNRINKDFNNQSEGIMSLLNPNSRSSTTIRRILESQLRNKSMNLLSSRQQNGVTLIKQLSGNPSNTDDFIVNSTQNILNYM